MIVRKKQLAVKANDNHGHSYDVFLVMEDGPCGEMPLMSKEEQTEKYGHKWALRIKDTPGGWYMSTLLPRYMLNPQNNIISLDYGQKWDCINFNLIMAEAVTLI